jgi:hypothetical protein
MTSNAPECPTTLQGTSVPGQAPSIAPMPQPGPSTVHCSLSTSPTSPLSLPAAAAAGIIRPGDILHARTFTPLAWGIRRCVHSWGTHDALVVRDNGELCIGDAAPMKCHCTPLADYQRRFEAGKVQFFVCRPVVRSQKSVVSSQKTPPSDSCLLNPDSCPPHSESCILDSDSSVSGMLAAYWWLQNVKGKKYDFAAYPRLFLKSIFGDICQAAAGWEWAWYCTESCRDAWRNGAGIDPYQKNNPTPRTTEKRIESGALQIVYNPMPDFSLTSAKYTSQASVVSSQKSVVSSQNVELPPSESCLLNPDSCSRDLLIRDAIQGFSLRKGYGI